MDTAKKEGQLYFPKTTAAGYPDLIVQSNQLTAAKYNLDLVDKRIFYRIIEKVRTTFIEKKQDPGATVDLWGNLIVRLLPSDLDNIDNISRIYPKLINFKSKTVTINDEHSWTAIGLVNYVKHNKRENYVEVEVSKELLPHLVELSEQFTAYSLSVAISFKSQFTQRFYELCQRWKAKGYFFYTVDELKEMFDIVDQYKKFSDLKRFVIDKAKTELLDSFNSKTIPASDIYFDWKVKDKDGKKKNKTNTLEFFIYDQSSDLYGNWGLADYKYNTRQILVKYYPTDRTYMERVLAALDSVSIANKIFTRLQDKEFYYKNEMRMNSHEIARILRTIIKEDFQIL